MIDDEDEIGNGLAAPGSGGSVLDAILSGASAGSTRGMLAADSRYAPVGVAMIDLPMDESGQLQTVVYFRRRFVPDPGQFAVLRSHAVCVGERLDHIASRHFDDPLTFWKLCDANRIMRPLDFPGDIIGRRLRVPLPQGVPAPSARD